MGKRSDLLLNILNTAVELDNPTWAKIIAKLDYKDYDIIVIRKKIKEYFNMKLLPFIKAVCQYKFEENDLTKIMSSSANQSDKVSFILYSMGLNDSEERIIEIAKTAVKINDLTIEKVMSRTQIPIEEWNNARMEFATFLHNYSIKHGIEPMKVMDFIELLRSYVF